MLAIPRSRIILASRIYNDARRFILTGLLSKGIFVVAITVAMFHYAESRTLAEDFRKIKLKQSVNDVQPMTGIVLWTTNEKVRDAPIQLEFSYLTYAQIVDQNGDYDWSPLESILSEVSQRRHQLIVRWHDTYVGKTTGVPASITRLPHYKLHKAKSEGKPTEFSDWSTPELQQFALEFFTRFSEKYDNDPRLAFVQVGFGLWAEYHIYDGPMQLGNTFPTKEYQATFAKHLNQCLRSTPWMISVDAANSEWSAFPDSRDLLTLPFGLFDDSFNHAKHARENAPNWDRLGRERWKSAPTGGEFSFFQEVDQAKALAPKGPHGISFEQQASRFHVTFMIGDDQLRFQNAARLREAGLACGYRFEVQSFEASETRSRATIRNIGIAPFYYDAFPAINGVQSPTSLKGLLPGQSRAFEISSGGPDPQLTIESARLVPGQRIGFIADLQ